MRIVSNILVAVTLSLGAIATAAAAPDTPVAHAAKVEASKSGAIRIPASMLRYYCLAGGDLYSIGAVTCIMRGMLGTCKWTGNGSNYSAPPNTSYWVTGVAPTGSCP